MTVCKDVGYKGAKFMSGGSYFQHSPTAYTPHSFAITHLECRENDKHITDCYGSNKIHEMCDTGSGAGVICE